MNEEWPWIEAAHGMRSQLFDILSDADLAFTPGGQNMTVGALCREMDETEYTYIQSLKALKQEWSYRHTDAGAVSSVARLKVWFHTLDDEMKDAVAAFSDEDAREHPIRVRFLGCRDAWKGREEWNSGEVERDARGYTIATEM
jgi:hypothetical protein